MTTDFPVDADDIDVEELEEAAVEDSIEGLEVKPVVFHEDNWAKVIYGDCLLAMREMPDNSVDAIVTDPPYGLTKIDEAKTRQALTEWLTGDDSKVPSGKGFMNHAWDNFVPPPAVWREALRVLKPGGYMLCFAGSRTIDLMTLSVRLGGFEIKDTIEWIYGCFSEDTEAFVNGEWVHYSKAKPGDEVLCYDHNTDSYSRGHIEETFEYDYNKHIYCLESLETRQRVSDNHQCIVWRDGRWAKVPAHQLRGFERVPFVQDENSPVTESTSVRVSTVPYTGKVWCFKVTTGSFVVRRGGKVFPSGNSGFPKSLNISKAIDAKLGAERKVVGTRKTNVGMQGGNFANKSAQGSVDITESATDEAKKWEGWGTALKPAHEPILCARKPLSLIPSDWRLVTSVHHALAELLWLSLSPAKRAEISSPSSRAERGEGWCASALISAVRGMSREECERTGTFNSPETASTFSNIASSWSNILDALSASMKTSTTSMKSSTTTDLKTLNSLLDQSISPSTMLHCECLPSGLESSAQSAGKTSKEGNSNWMLTPNPSVPETVTDKTVREVESLLVRVAETLSGDQAEGNFADGSATTEAGANNPDTTHRPIIAAQKPLEGTYADNITKHGTGGLNIDGARIVAAPGADDDQAIGRFPTNVVLSHLPECEDETCVDGCQIAEMDEQSGERAAGNHPANRQGFGGVYTDGTERSGTSGERRPTDSGGASRYFPAFRYQAKAKKEERPKYVNADGELVAHPTVKPTALITWMLELVVPKGGVVLDPFLGSGTTCEAATLAGFESIGIENYEPHLPLIKERLEGRDLWTGSLLD